MLWSPGGLRPPDWHDLGGLDNLRMLHLFRGSISLLPDGFFGYLENLTDLRITYTNISELSAAKFGHRARYLTSLAIWRNGLTSLEPDGSDGNPASIFADMVALETLSVVEKGVSTIPSNLLVELAPSWKT